MFPLKNVRVLDLTRILAGPLASMQLADLGAEVIKIEPISGDETRKWGPPYLNDNSDISTYYLALNRNKYSLGLNLKCKEGLEIVNELVKTSDIFLENFSPGVTSRLSISYSDIRKIKDNIIYGSIKGYGSKGPMANSPSFDAAVQAVSGFMSINGEVEHGPYKVGVAIVDVVTGLFLTNAITAALYQRTITGEGCEVEVNMLESALASLVNIASAGLNSEKPIIRQGNAHPSIVPYSTFSTSDCDVMIACGTNKQFSELCELLEIPQLSRDSRFAENSSRTENRLVLTEILQKRLNSWNSKDFLKAAELRHIPVTRVNSVKEALNLDQIHLNSTIEYLSSNSNQTAKFIRSPIRYNSSKNSEISTTIKFPPAISEDRNWVLSQVLGYSKDKINDLISREIVK